MLVACGVKKVQNKLSIEYHKRNSECTAFLLKLLPSSLRIHGVSDERCYDSKIDKA